MLMVVDFDSIEVDLVLVLKLRRRQVPVPVAFDALMSWMAIKIPRNTIFTVNKLNV